MNHNALTILFLCFPAICGGAVALINSPKVNDASEKLESLIRQWEGIIAVKKGFFSKWVVNPPLRIIVKLYDWTDSLAHRGVKNGIRAATALYVLEVWLLLIGYAFMFVLSLIFKGIMWIVHGIVNGIMWIVHGIVNGIMWIVKVIMWIVALRIALWIMGQIFGGGGGGRGPRGGSGCTTEWHDLANAVDYSLHHHH
jgi:hypothetical protein